MNITVEYIDQAGVIHNQTHKLTRLAFAKHLAIAGQKYLPMPQKLIRTLGMFFHYNNYIQREAFDEGKFSEPPKRLYDPTEKGQFSNLAGKAIADFLSKRINQSIHTVNYEAAMKIRKIPIKGKRPDLLAFKQNSQFAIEAKGYSDKQGNMARHKEQSRTGSIKVDFTIACVSYNLYKNIKCKYHDPFNDDKEYDDELLGELTKNYYYGLSKFLDKEYFDYQEYEFWGEPFYKVQLTKLFQYKFPFFNLFDIPSLLLPAKIKEYAENGLNRNFEPFIFDTTNEISNNIYIDNDRVGLIFERPSSGAITPEHLLIDF